MRGESHATLGNHADALNDFLQASQIDPKNQVGFCPEFVLLQWELFKSVISNIVQSQATFIGIMRPAVDF